MYERAMMGQSTPPMPLGKSTLDTKVCSIYHFVYHFLYEMLVTGVNKVRPSVSEIRLTLYLGELIQ